MTIPRFYGPTPGWMRRPPHWIATRPADEHKFRQPHDGGDRKLHRETPAKVGYQCRDNHHNACSKLNCTCPCHPRI